jgi:DNA-binding transcriptional MerR regulator
MGILPPPARTESGYRVYGHEVLALLRFVVRARRLGFSLAEIRDIAAIRRSGQPPCSHVQELVHRKVAALDQVLRELTATRRALRAVLASWPSSRRRAATVCPHIEEGGDFDGVREGVSLPGMRGLPRGRGPRGRRDERPV